MVCEKNVVWPWNIYSYNSVEAAVKDNKCKISKSTIHVSSKSRVKYPSLRAGGLWFHVYVNKGRFYVDI